MGDEPVSDRNAAIESQFRQLPPAGSADYWARLEDAAPGTRLPLEVLAMCYRERHAAQQPGHAERILTTLLRKVQPTIERWAYERTPKRTVDFVRVVEDMCADCVGALWRELAGEGPTFLTEGFWHKLSLLFKNTAEQRLIAEGAKTHVGVEHPTRIPGSLRERLDKPLGPDDPRTLGETLADPADDAFSLSDFLHDLRDVYMKLNADEQALVENLITGELTQTEMGRRLGISDRAVRMRLENLRAKLRALLHERDDPAGQSDGQPGGEEERA